MIAVREFDYAIETYRQLLELGRDARKATNLASALLWKGDTAGAIQTLHAALQMDLNYPWAHYCVAVTRARQHEYDQARAGLKSKPDFAEAELYVGLTYAGLGWF
jgi:tetratricopeptide (TPR) repeat protein